MKQYTLFTINILIGLLTLRVSAECWHNLFQYGIRGFNVSEEKCLTVLEAPKQEGNLYDLAVASCKERIPGGALYDSMQLKDWETYVQLNDGETVFFNLMLTHSVKRGGSNRNVIAFSAKHGSGNALVIPYIKTQVVWTPKTGRSTYLSNEDIESLFSSPDSWYFLNPLCIIWQVGRNTTSLSFCKQKANVSYIICQNEPFRGCKPRSGNFLDGCIACPSRRTGKYCQFEEKIKLERERKEQSYTHATVLVSVLIVVLVAVALKSVLYFRKKIRDRDTKSPGQQTNSPSEELKPKSPAQSKG